MTKKLFTSESVTEGHPDKICDQISDKVLDACLEQDENSRVACECAIKDDTVFLFGEITTNAKLDYRNIVVSTLKDIGYTKKEYGFDIDNFNLVTSINHQSPDIKQGVDNDKDQGAGDQGIMFGYACNETTSFMPLSIDLAHKLAKKLSEVRKDGTLPYLRPDGKTQVTVEYEEDKIKRIHTIVVSTQHDSDISQKTIRQDIIKHVIEPIVDKELLDEHTIYHINPTGKFVHGGPESDAGLTGRKIIVDTYGGHGAHGGGAFSGKDASKVDRSAAYMARKIAKDIIRRGWAKKCLVQLSYAIGLAKPVSINVSTFGTGCLMGDEHLAEKISKSYDLRPASIINELDLKQPIYSKTSAYGHFGKEDLPWESP